MDGGKDMRFEFRQVYDQMGLGGYNACSNSRLLITTELKQIVGDRITITDKGRHISAFIIMS